MTSVLRPCLLTDNIAKTDDFYALEMLATVANKVYETEHTCCSNSRTIEMPVEEKNALLPCLGQKRKLEDTELPKNCKKTRLIVHLRHPGLPLEYKDRITKLGGTDLRLLIYKKLLKSDVDTKKSRLIMPYNKCLVDLSVIRESRVKMIQPSNDFSDMSLTFAKRDNESSYVFTDSWNDVVEVNHFQMGDSIQVWTFNNEDQLSFALVKL